MRVGLFGRGRLASAIAEEALSQGHEVAWRLGRGETPSGPVDVAIDASKAEALPEHLAWTLETSTPFVIGTTGWTLPDLETRIAGRIGVLIAPNFSLGVALQRRMAFVLARFAALDAQRDLFLEERHHRLKADAPSGTAKALASALLAGNPAKRGASRAPLEGRMPDDQLCVAVTRAGSAFGTHTVGIDAPSELITLTHEARSRQAFAGGALMAAAWVRERKGLFTFDQLAAETLDPLFDLGGFR
jgi:4-hydroxy-tetrahydrodipicolinate reductase